MKRNRRATAAALALVAGSLLVSACSSGSDSAAAGSASGSSSASPTGSQELPTTEQFCKDTVLVWDSAVLQAQAPKDSAELNELMMAVVAATQELAIADEVGALDATGAERIQRTMAISLLLMASPELAEQSSAAIAEAAGMSTEQVDEAKTQAFKDAARKDYQKLGTFCSGVLGTGAPSSPASASASAS